MNLGEKDKELILLIANSEIQSFYDFWALEFQKVEPLKTEKSELACTGINVSGEYNLFTRNKTYFGLSDPRKRKLLYEVIIRFIIIIKTLEEEKLIFTLDAVTTAFPALLFKNDNNQYYYNGYIRTNRLILQFKDLLIFRTPALQTFIESKYRTSDEVTRDEELKHRSKSHNLTLWVAITSITVSTIATIFNIFLSNKNREVHITNPGPTEIRITNLDSLNQLIQSQSDILRYKVNSNNTDINKKNVADTTN